MPGKSLTDTLKTFPVWKGPWDLDFWPTVSTIFSTWEDILKTPLPANPCLVNYCWKTKPKKQKNSSYLYLYSWNGAYIFYCIVDSRGRTSTLLLRIVTIITQFSNDIQLLMGERRMFEGIYHAEIKRHQNNLSMSFDNN